MRKEADVKEAVKKVLNTLGVYWFMPVQTGYGVKGIPDFVCCVKGRFFGIETKFGKNTLSTWQKKQQDKILAAGGTYMVIDEDSVAYLYNYLFAILELEDAGS